RLVPGGEVRLRGLGIARCTGFHEDRTGGVAAVSVVLDPASRPGAPGAERKVRGTIHWLSARHACAARFRLYDRLFAEADPETAGEEPPALNPRSLEELEGFVEPGLASVSPESRFQFERLGYFVADRVLHRPARPVFNRIVTLRDGWGGGHG
ncbi:MAG: glutamine--tRNA ligase, partial [Anaerolineae bacterium]|nr:glutamine--tRNA ligase [Anaerolineae bacterium]